MNYNNITLHLQLDNRQCFIINSFRRGENGHLAHDVTDHEFLKSAISFILRRDSIRSLLISKNGKIYTSTLLGFASIDICFLLVNNKIEATQRQLLIEKLGLGRVFTWTISSKSSKSC